MNFEKTTEKSSNYNNLEQMSVQELLNNINNEDQKVALAVQQVIPKIESLVTEIVIRLKKGGRLFYIGAGTSGRIGILDASECPPTFGVSHDVVIGLIAGGDVAIRKAVENAEDSTSQGWNDLLEYNISQNDVLIGIAASGTTPYVVSALEKANRHDVLTGSITMNEGSPLALIPNHPIVCTVGPEFVTGSSRMKAGTAQKLILNMISTTVMIQLGHVKGNKMVDMKLSNDKLVERGIKMIIQELEISKKEAKKLLLEHQSVRKAIKNYQTNENK